MNPPASSESRMSCLTRAMANRIPSVRKVIAQGLERVDGREVDLRVRLGVEQEPLDRRHPLRRRRPLGGRASRSRRSWRRTAASRSGRRRAPAPARRGVVVDVVHPGHVRDVAQHAVVRVDDPAQQVEHGEHDGRRRSPGSTPKTSTAAVVDERQDELAVPEGRDPAQLRDVDESQCRVDDDGAEGRGREGGDERARARAASRRPGRARRGSAAACAHPWSRRGRCGYRSS